VLLATLPSKMRAVVEGERDIAVQSAKGAIALAQATRRAIREGGAATARLVTQRHQAAASSTRVAATSASTLVDLLEQRFLDAGMQLPAGETRTLQACQESDDTPPTAMASV